MPEAFRNRIVVFIGLLLGSLGVIHAQNFSDQTFLVAGLPPDKISQQSVNNELKNSWSGLEIKLYCNKEGNQLAFSPEPNSPGFEEFAVYLQNFLENHRERIIPIFIEYTGPVGALKNAFINSRLSERLFFLPPGERWPDIKQITAQNKNLVVFTFQKIRSNSLFHFAWDYIAEFPHSGLEDPPFDGFYPNGDISKELLMIRDLGIPSTSFQTGRFLLDINQNQFYINHLLNRWKYSGKRPSFIFANNNPKLVSQLIPWLNTYKNVKGVVRISDKPMEKVFWKHSSRSITNGFFSFPFSEGEELNLTPFSPGYRFDPKTSVVSNENFISSLAFSASPIEMSTGLTAFFPFDNQWQNYLSKSDIIKPANTSFTTDINRGEVARMPQNACIRIGKPEQYGLKNNSFSVSVWVKFNEITPDVDNCILGSPETIFRRGLHLVIRDGRPYFGFFGNDLWAEKSVTPLEWHHIVFRYNYFNGEQAIYIDGQNVGSSFNHASFIGDSTLIIGKSIGQDNYLNGYIDDLYIWARPLGEEEILYLNNSKFIPETNTPQRFPILPFFAGFASVALVFSVFLILRQKKYARKKSGGKQAVAPHEKIPNKNTVYLFGEFTVYDNSGNEISNQFTPKIKELFLLILLYTIKNGKGIKTEKLTSVLWYGFSANKAANNRSVTFNKLRKLIEPVQGIEVTFHNGYWKTEFSNGFFCDYLEAFSLLKIKSHPSPEVLQQFFDFVKKGVFLHEIQWEWLDEFKGNVANEIIDVLLHYASLLREKEDSALLKAIAERILAVDDVNEKALQIVVKQLINSNNQNQARFRFNQFRQTYSQAYGQEYNRSFEEFQSFDFT